MRRLVRSVLVLCRDVGMPPHSRRGVVLASIVLILVTTCTPVVFAGRDFYDVSVVRLLPPMSLGVLV